MYNKLKCFPLLEDPFDIEDVSYLRYINHVYGGNGLENSLQLSKSISGKSSTTLYNFPSQLEESVDGRAGEDGVAGNMRNKRFSATFTQKNIRMLRYDKILLITNSSHIKLHTPRLQALLTREPSKTFKLNLLNHQEQTFESGSQ